MNGPHGRVTAAATAAALLVTVQSGAAASARPDGRTTPAERSDAPGPCPQPSPAPAPAAAAASPAGPPSSPAPSPSTPAAPTPESQTAAGGADSAPASATSLHRHAYRRLAVPPPNLVLPPAQAMPHQSAPAGADTPPGATTALDDCAPKPSDSPAAQHGTASRAGTPGASGLGDPYFKSAGNGGYDVRHYAVDLTYGGKGEVAATVRITAKATQVLSRFNLDFRGPRITDVTVDGEPAKHARQGQELTVTPAAPPAAGTTFTTVVRYAGRPGPIRSGALGTYGWVPSKDGALVLSEPDGAPTWLPVNDHPSDKATYSFRVTVPKHLQVLANGTPGRTVAKGGTATYQWDEKSPMASYLAMVAIGRFQTMRGKAGSIPVITAVDPRFKSAAKRLHSTTVAALKWEAKTFGKYPFATAGGIVDDPRLDYALETQERPVYAGFAPDEDFVVHELAHQWFGNSVTVRSWADIWLNEGFATYAEWLWAERGKKDSAKKIFKRYYRQPADSPIFSPPPGRPGAREMFGFSVYIRGAMTLQALRQRVGDKKFFTILRTWASGRPGRNATTADFIAHAEKTSGRQLDRLFDAWLHKKGKPKKW
ncbi:M1 family metallopeptidase [Spirillospora sp. NPDC050679]